MSEWCQNKKCPEKKNQGQIRGNKGSKYYQSNKSSGYYEYWCSMGCRDAWWNEHKHTCMQAVGFIDKQIIHLEANANNMKDKADLTNEGYKEAIAGTGFEVIKVVSVDKIITDAEEARKLVD